MLEIEVSLWSYEQNIKDALAFCAKEGIPVFCYSPLGRGFMTRKWKSPEDIPEGSFQKYLPRFQGEAFYENLKLVDQLDELAKKKGVTTGQFALAWIISLGDSVSLPTTYLVKSRVLIPDYPDPRLVSPRAGARECRCRAHHTHRRRAQRGQRYTGQVPHAG